MFRTRPVNTLTICILGAAVTIAEAGQPKEDGAAERALSRDNLHRIGRAMHAFHDIYNHLPTPAIYGKDGQPILSWRVAILPFLGEEKLYAEFKLDEPWDSEHNRKLLAKMPKAFAPPGIKTKEPNVTFYQVFVGPGAIFEGRPVSLVRDIPDGTSCTIMVVEAGEPVPWTKPQDLPFDPKKELPKLGGIFEGGFHFLSADGAVHDAKKTPDPKKMKAAIRRDSGEIKDLNDLEP
jgi:hypothetical protein